jgi:hypothetical protein
MFYIKRVLNLMLYETDFGVLKFKNPLLKPRLNLLNFFFEFFNIPLINIALKWHYINMFRKNDSLLVI